jgi:hypothetical protein
MSASPTSLLVSTKADGVRDYFRVGVVAYSGLDARNGFQGILSNGLLHPISEIADTPLRIETRFRKTAGPDDVVLDEAVKFLVRPSQRRQDIDVRGTKDRARSDAKVVR